MYAVNFQTCALGYYFYEADSFFLKVFAAFPYYKYGNNFFSQ